jgi:hypothetical protein
MMGPNEERVRERMARDADIMRGVGGVIGTADMRAYGEELSWAAVEDSRYRHKTLIDGTVVVTHGDRAWVEEMGDGWLQDIDYQTGAIDMEEAQNRHAAFSIEFVRKEHKRIEDEESGAAFYRKLQAEIDAQVAAAEEGE